MKHNIRTFVGALLALTIMVVCFMPTASALSVSQDPAPLDITSTFYQKEPPLDINSSNASGNQVPHLYDESVFFYEDLQLNDPSVLLTTDEHCSMKLCTTQTIASAKLPDDFSQADLLSRYAILLVCFTDTTAVTQNFFLGGDLDSHSKSLTISYTDKNFGLIEVTFDNRYVVVNGIVLADTCQSDLQVLVFEDGAVCVSFMNVFGELEMKFLRPVSHFSQPDYSIE